MSALEHRVVFARIGRKANPESIVRALSGEQLADSIALHARQFLGSPAFEVVVDMEQMRGWIFAGVRTAGTFTIEAVPGGDR